MFFWTEQFILRIVIIHDGESRKIPVSGKFPYMSQQPPAAQGAGIICNLAQLRKGESATIIGLADGSDANGTFMKARLQELGFLPGESIYVHAEAFPGRDPMAIRIGNSIFALRRQEAANIYVAQNGHESA